MEMFTSKRRRDIYLADEPTHESNNKVSIWTYLVPGID